MSIICSREVPHDPPFVTYATLFLRLLYVAEPWVPTNDGPYHIPVSALDTLRATYALWCVSWAWIRSFVGIPGAGAGRAPADMVYSSCTGHAYVVGWAGVSS